MVFASTLYILKMKIVQSAGVKIIIIIKIKEFLVKSFENMQRFQPLKTGKTVFHSNDTALELTTNN